MRFLVWGVLPACAITTSALVIPPVESSNSAVAGSTALPHGTPEALTSLEREYEKLEELKHQLFKLHHEVMKQEHEILALINSDFKACSGISCYVQTALKKAPDFFELFKTHFRPHPKNETISFWDCPWSTRSSDPSKAPVTVEVESLPTPQVLPTPPVPPPPPVHPLEPTPPKPPTEPTTPPVPFDHSDGHQPPSPPSPPPLPSAPPPPPPPSPPRPPLPPNHPEYNPWKPNPNDPAPHPDGKQQKGHRPFHMPHPAPRHRHYKLIFATAGGVITVITLGILFKAAHVYFSNPRVRAEHAARIEERRTMREYRKAACQHRLRLFLSRFRMRRRSRSRGSADYEEKRAMIQRVNSVDASGHLLGADINSLRRAHEIVGQLVRAEQGRMHHSHAHLHHIHTHSDGAEASSSSSVRSLRTTTTLPPYAPPPPRYSQELNPDMEVVDGFRYTPSQSEATTTSSASSFVFDDADLATESSVVDCASRISIDTE